MFKKNTTFVKRKKYDKTALLFPFPHILAGAHLPRVPRPIFRKFKTLSNMERMIKKYGRSELKRKGTQEP